MNADDYKALSATLQLTPARVEEVFRGKLFYVWHNPQLKKCLQYLREHKQSRRRRIPCLRNVRATKECMVTALNGALAALESSSSPNDNAPSSSTAAAATAGVPTSYPSSPYAPSSLSRPTSTSAPRYSPSTTGSSGGRGGGGGGGGEDGGTRILTLDAALATPAYMDRTKRSPVWSYPPQPRAVGSIHRLPSTLRLVWPNSVMAALGLVSTHLRIVSHGDGGFIPFETCMVVRCNGRDVPALDRGWTIALRRKRNAKAYEVVAPIDLTEYCAPVSTTGVCEVTVAFQAEPTSGSSYRAPYLIVVEHVARRPWSELIADVQQRTDALLPQAPPPLVPTLKDIATHCPVCVRQKAKAIPLATPIHLATPSAKTAALVPVATTVAPTSTPAGSGSGALAGISALASGSGASTSGSGALGSGDGGYTTLRRCSKCKMVWYCSAAHQWEDWTCQHKDKCKPYQETLEERMHRERLDKWEHDKREHQERSRKRKLEGVTTTGEGGGGGGGGEGGEEDDDICEAECTVSLLCPLLVDRIRTPATGKHCTHLRAFDLEAYLEVSQATGLWQCPLCGIALPFADLLVDTFVADLLQDTKAATAATAENKGDEDGSGGATEVRFRRQQTTGSQGKRGGWVRAESVPSSSASSASSSSSSNKRRKTTGSSVAVGARATVPVDETPSPTPPARPPLSHPPLSSPSSHPPLPTPSHMPRSPVLQQSADVITIDDD